MRYAMCLLLLAGLATGCETAFDPATGERQTRWTLPLTEGNREAARERWFACVQFRSESFCERTVPGGRPPGIAPVAGGAWPGELVDRDDP